HAVDQHSELSGTGFFVDPAGTLYTSYSVAGEAENFTIEAGEKKYHARLLVADLRSGIALLKVDAVTPFLTVGKSGALGLAISFGLAKRVTAGSGSMSKRLPLRWMVHEPK